MPNTLPLMNLSPEEAIFLRHWIYDEMHYQTGQGPAKRLQLAHQVAPADLAALLAVAMPVLGEQEAAGIGPPPTEPPVWPWPGDECKRRIAEARSLLPRNTPTAKPLAKGIA